MNSTVQIEQRQNGNLYYAGTCTPFPLPGEQRTPFYSTVVHIGDIVRWQRGRKPLGKVVHLFRYNDNRFAVVAGNGTLKVVRVYEKLEVMSHESTTTK